MSSNVACPVPTCCYAVARSTRAVATHLVELHLLNASHAHTRATEYLADEERLKKVEPMNGQPDTKGVNEINGAVQRETVTRKVGRSKKLALAPSICRACGEKGHRRNACPHRPVGELPSRCGYCHGIGKHGPVCKKKHLRLKPPISVPEAQRLESRRVGRALDTVVPMDIVSRLRREVERREKDISGLKAALAILEKK